jgi:hypothetical protein
LPWERTQTVIALRILMKISSPKQMSSRCTESGASHTRHRHERFFGGDEDLGTARQHEPSALVEPGALRRRRPGVAAIGVFEHEPLRGHAHPLLQIDNVVCTPHIGFVTRGGFDL